MSEPMRRTQARIAERARRHKEQERKDKLRTTIPIVVMAIVAVVGLTYFVYTRTVKPPRPANAGIVGPKLEVDREDLDLGNRPLNVAVRAQFTVKNSGDDTLNLDVPKVVTALEGC